MITKSTSSQNFSQQSSFIELNTVQFEFNSLYQKQNKNRYYNSSFQNHHLRNKIISKFTKLLPISNFAYFTFIGLFDSINSRQIFEDNEMILISIVCLVLASKKCDSKNFILKYSDFKKIFKNLPINRLFILEVKVLRLMNFDLNLVTPYDFTMFFCQKFCLIEGYNYHNETSNLNKTIYINTKKVLCFFASNYHLNEYTSLTLALLSIMITRSNLKMQPLIPKFLKELIGCNEGKLMNLFFKFKIAFRNLHVLSNE
jgi:hypothetical protein